MTWSRVDATAALTAALQATCGEGVWIFARPPMTVNPPAIVVGRPTEVVYATAGFGVDRATLPVLCVGPADGEDMVDTLIGLVRASLADPSLGQAVQTTYAEAERNWHNLNVAGADLLQAEVTLIIHM
jgi:hypothetical protein